MSSYPPPPPPPPPPPSGPPPVFPGPPPPPTGPPFPGQPGGAAYYPGYGLPNAGGATASMIMGIASIVTACFCPIVAATLGAVAFFVGLGARARVRASAGTLGGDGQALAGVITGAIGGALGVLGLIVAIIYLILIGLGIVTGAFPTPTPS